MVCICKRQLSRIACTLHVDISKVLMFKPVKNHMSEWIKCEFIEVMSTYLGIPFNIWSTIIQISVSGISRDNTIRTIKRKMLGCKCKPTSQTHKKRKMKASVELWGFQALGSSTMIINNMLISFDLY